MFVPEDIDPEPMPGLRGRRLYRRVQLDGLHYEGVVRYPRELENRTDDVRLRITEFLNLRSSRLGWDVVAGELYNPLDVPILSSPNKQGSEREATPPTVRKPNPR